MYLERLKRASLTERGFHFTFSSSNTEKSVEFSREAAEQIRQALQNVLSKSAPEHQLTLTVVGHQIVRAPSAYGILLRTQELGDVVFSVPPEILQRLIADLTDLASSPLPPVDSRRLPSTGRSRLKRSVQ